MVKITNGTNVFEVTRGAFDGIYSKQGYTIMGDKPATNNGNVNDNKKTDDELFLDAVIEKPISQWSKDEVKRFAALREIDISGTKNVNEAKDLIKDFLDGQE